MILLKKLFDFILSCLVFEPGIAGAFVSGFERFDVRQAVLHGACMRCRGVALDDLAADEIGLLVADTIQRLIGAVLDDVQGAVADAPGSGRKPGLGVVEACCHRSIESDGHLGHL